MTSAPGLRAGRGLPELEPPDYARILRVVEECGSAGTFAGFREAVVESLRRRLGYRNVTFFTGDSLPAVFRDSSPVTVGRARRMESSYLDHFHLLDPFALLCRGRAPVGPAPLSLEAVAGAGGTGVRRHEEYFERFLFRHRIHAKVVLPISGVTGAAGIGLLAEESGAFGPLDLARLTALAPHLVNLFVLHNHSAAPRSPGHSGLTRRQAEVAQMAALGASNQQIAAALHISVDTVKKHLTAAYAALGCTTRTQLAALWSRRREPSFPLPDGRPGP